MEYLLHGKFCREYKNGWGITLFSKGVYPYGKRDGSYQTVNFAENTSFDKMREKVDLHNQREKNANFNIDKYRIILRIKHDFHDYTIRNNQL